MRERKNAQDLDLDGCMLLVNQMTINMFKDLKRVLNYPISDPKERIIKINEVIRYEYEICCNKFTRYVLTDVPGTVENCIKEFSNLEVKDKDNYEIKDKRTGVRFISYLKPGEVCLLREKSYLTVTKIKKEKQ